MSETVVLDMVLAELSSDAPTKGQVLDAVERWLEAEEVQGVRVEVLRAVGSGGGWPEVAFTGERAALLELARAYGMPSDEFEDMIGMP